MLKLSESTLEKITQNSDEIEYLKSYAFDMKRHMKRTQKRTGMTRREVSLLVAEKFASHKPSATYMDRLTSFDRFQKQGDIHKYQHENIVKYLNSL